MGKYLIYRLFNTGYNSKEINGSTPSLSYQKIKTLRFEPSKPRKRKFFIIDFEYSFLLRNLYYKDRKKIILKYLKVKNLLQEGAIAPSSLYIKMKN